ncbi:MAG: phytanoyl-CoA dioxygenase, partial [Pseudomonadota bacterium]
AVTGADLPDRLSQRGSLRATEEDLREMGCREPIRFAVPANTLVIADTNGFHRRGHSPKPSHRVAIYASSRSNPFNPWPGLPLRAWRRLEHWVRDWEYRRDDAKAAARGGQPIWRKVEPSRLRRDVG